MKLKPVLKTILPVLPVLLALHALNIAGASTYSNEVTAKAK